MLQILKKYRKYIVIGTTAGLVVGSLYLWYKNSQIGIDDAEETPGRPDSVILPSASSDASQNNNSTTTTINAAAGDRNAAIDELIEQARLASLNQQMKRSEFFLAEMQSDMPYVKYVDIYLCQQFCTSQAVDHHVLFEVAQNATQRQLANYFQFVAISQFDKAREILNKFIIDAESGDPNVLAMYLNERIMLNLHVISSLRAKTKNENAFYEVKEPYQEQIVQDCKTIVLLEGVKTSQYVAACFQTSKAFDALLEINQKIHYLNLAIRKLPTYVAALLERAALLVDQNKIELAVEDAQATLKADPENDSAMLIIALGYYYNQDFDRCIGVITTTLKKHPKLNAYHHLASCYSVKYKDFAMIMSTLDNGIEARPNDAFLYQRMKGYYNMLYCNFDEALKIFQNDALYESLMTQATTANVKQAEAQETLQERIEMIAFIKTITRFIQQHQLQILCVAGTPFKISSEFLEELQVQDWSSNAKMYDLIDFMVFVIFSERGQEGNIIQCARDIKELISGTDYESIALRQLCSNGLLAYRIVQEYLDGEMKINTREFLEQATQAARQSNASLPQAALKLINAPSSLR